MAGARSLTLLHVDEDDDVRIIVELALGLTPMISVRSATCVEAAINDLVHDPWRPDLFLLDATMPGWDGSSALAALGAVPGCSEIPGLFLTAHVHPRETDQLIAAGGAGVIAKPFDPLLLGTQILAVIDRAA